MRSSNQSRDANLRIDQYSECYVGVSGVHVEMRFPGHGTIFLVPGAAKHLSDLLMNAAERLEPREIFPSAPQIKDGSSE